MRCCGNLWPDYIQYLASQKRKQEGDLNSLRKEVVALQIMRANYEQLVKAHQQAPQLQEDLVPDEVKFQVSRIFIAALTSHLTYFNRRSFKSLWTRCSSHLTSKSQ